LFAGIGFELLAWFLAFRNTIDNWTFALLTGALLFALPHVAAAVNPSAYPQRRRTGGERADGAVPLELMGIDRAFTPDELHEIDRGVGFERLHA
jgi:hypothetical protein